MKCKECIHSNVCANNSIIETKYVKNELLSCPDYEPANLFYKLPVPEGTPIYRIEQIVETLLKDVKEAYRLDGIDIGTGSDLIQ